MNNVPPYLSLAVAIVCEVIGSSFLKASDGFTKPGPTVLMALFFCVTFYALSLALRSIPMGVAYVTWAGLGIVLTAAVGTIVFKQRLDAPALAGLSLIIAGAVVLNFFSKASAH